MCRAFAHSVERKIGSMVIMLNPKGERSILHCMILLSKWTIIALLGQYSWCGNFSTATAAAAVRRGPFCRSKHSSSTLLTVAQGRHSQYFPNVRYWHWTTSTLDLGSPTISAVVRVPTFLSRIRTYVPRQLTRFSSRHLTKLRTIHNWLHAVINTRITAVFIDSATWGANILAWP